jgi:hypothetical protein
MKTSKYAISLACAVILAISMYVLFNHLTKPSVPDDFNDTPTWCGECVIQTIDGIVYFCCDTFTSEIRFEANTYYFSADTLNIPAIMTNISPVPSTMEYRRCPDALLRYNEGEWHVVEYPFYCYEVYNATPHYGGQAGFWVTSTNMPNKTFETGKYRFLKTVTLIRQDTDHPDYDEYMRILNEAQRLFDEGDPNWIYIYPDIEMPHLSQFYQHIVWAEFVILDK